MLLLTLFLRSYLELTFLSSLGSNFCLFFPPNLITLLTVLPSVQVLTLLFTYLE